MAIRDGSEFSIIRFFVPVGQSRFVTFGPLKVGYGICETPADFENTQLKWSYPLSFNADSDSTHSKYMDAQSCTSANTDARERAIS